MLQKALIGKNRYYAWLAFLLAVIGVGTLCYLLQFFKGLGVTGLGRDVTWGFYIAQFTFMVGVAASAVMVVLPYYLHDYKAFGKLTVLGEFLAVSAVVVCMLSIFVDMGQPLRGLNMLLYATPGSVMFWDMIVLVIYLGLNIIIAWTCLDCERNHVPPPKWVKPLIYLSIPWAVSIHTVTAFLYSGLPGRHFWLTAILAPRFLVSAFAAGPALLVLLCLLVRKLTTFDPGKAAIQKLGVVVLYAMILNVFFVLLEVFTAFYSGIPGHQHSIAYLFAHGPLVPFMWLSAFLAITAIVVMLGPSRRKNETVLAWCCAMIFLACWIDKGLGLVIGGLAITPLERVASYTPTVVELLITAGVYAIGALVLTVLYKIAITVKESETVQKPASCGCADGACSTSE